MEITNSKNNFKYYPYKGKKNEKKNDKKNIKKVENVINNNYEEKIKEMLNNKKYQDKLKEKYKSIPIDYLIPNQNVIYMEFDSKDDMMNKLFKNILNNKPVESNIGPNIDKDKELKGVIDNMIKKKYEELDNEKELVEITKKINNLDDLIELGKNYDKNKRYTVNLKLLNELVEDLEKLNQMIGMENVKKSVCDMICMVIQRKRLNFETKMLHSKIVGPPGVGKTVLAYILADIYRKMKIVKKAKLPNNQNPMERLFGVPPPPPSEEFPVVFASVGDLKGQYLGHTAVKTQKKIDEANGGVLIIDEAYALGNQNDKDSYSSEIIDILVENMTKRSQNTIIFFIGYEEEVERNLLSMNRGFDRRITFTYKLEGYNEKELADIFLLKVKEEKWMIDDFAKLKLIDLIKDNKDLFKNYGGDIENYFFKVQIAHANRVFGLSNNHILKITIDDLNKGLTLIRSYKKKEKQIIPFMYS